MRELPELFRALVPQGPAPGTVRVRHEGEMRLEPRGRRLRFAATTEYAVSAVRFEWRARFPLSPLIRLSVVDAYDGVHGRLEGRLWGRLRVLRAPASALLDEGEALRYLAELPWVPHAFAANRELDLRADGDDAVAVSTRVGGREVTARLRFAGGDPVEATAVRGRQVGRQLVPTPWRGAFSGHAVVDGVRIPTAAEVAWELPDGPFTYFRARVTGLEVR